MLSYGFVAVSFTVIVLLSYVVIGIKPTSDVSCQPFSIHIGERMVCRCNKNGTWSHDECIQTFQTHTTLINKRQRWQCRPRHYTIVDCNVCYCNSGGQIDHRRCTKNQCGKKRFMEDTRRRTDMKCELNRWYSTAACQACYCYDGQNVLCNPSTHTTTQWGTINLTLCSPILLDELDKITVYSANKINRIAKKLPLRSYKNGYKSDSVNFKFALRSKFENAADVDSEEEEQANENNNKVSKISEENAKQYSSNTNLDMDSGDDEDVDKSTEISQPENSEHDDKSISKEKVEYNKNKKHISVESNESKDESEEDSGNEDEDMSISDNSSEVTKKTPKKPSKTPKTHSPTVTKTPKKPSKTPSKPQSNTPKTHAPTVTQTPKKPTKKTTAHSTTKKENLVPTVKYAKRSPIKTTTEYIKPLDYKPHPRPVSLRDSLPNKPAPFPKGFQNLPKATVRSKKNKKVKLGNSQKPHAKQMRVVL